MATRNTNTNATSGYWDEMFINAYTTGYKHVMQETRDVYSGATMVDVLQGENKSYDFVGTIELIEKTDRFGNIPIQDVTHNRRWMSPVYYRRGVYVDDEDAIAMHADPSSDYIQAIAKGVIRKKNDVIYDAFEANVNGGDNPGDDTYAFSDTLFTSGSANGRTIAHDTTNAFAAGGTSTGLTIEKLILAREALVDLHNDPNEVFHFVGSQRQVSQLIREAETQSIDTSPFKSLAVGNVPEFLGFYIHVDHNVVVGTTNDVGGDTNIYPCYAWSKQGILFAQHQSPIFKVDWLPEKAIWQISCRVGMNAIRMDENCIIKIECVA